MLFICAVLVFIVYWNTADSGAPDYTVFSTRDKGASLLFDTLKQMGYPVAASQRPVNLNANTNDVFIIINPNNPRVTVEMAEQMLTWVRRGGRLIFLDREFPTVMDRTIGLHARASVEQDYFNHYSLGLGHVITGRSDSLLNKRLMEDSQYGQLIQLNLHAMDADNIWFSEYYHGYRVEESFINQLPRMVQFAGWQLILITLALLWHTGKRFGKPVVYYEEVEREENEQVKALARLYGALKREANEHDD
jgi:hypothetical protein